MNVCVGFPGGGTAMYILVFSVFDSSRGEVAEVTKKMLIVVMVEDDTV
jgi:hypothetical protein